MSRMSVMALADLTLSPILRQTAWANALLQVKNSGHTYVVAAHPCRACLWWVMTMRWGFLSRPPGG